MKTRKLIIKSTFGLAGLLAVGLGCAAIQSTRREGNSGGSGLAYNLPKALFKLVVVEEISTPEPPQPPPATITTNLIITNLTTFRQVDTNAGSLKLKNDGRIELSGKGDSVVTNTITELQTINFDSMRQTNAAAGKPRTPTTNYFISLERELVPDRAESYLLQMNPSAFADDSVKIGVSNNLIQTIVLTNSDQTLSVLSNLTMAAVQFVKYAAMSAGAGDTITRRTNIFRFDPFSKDEWVTVSNRLVNMSTNISLNLSDITSATVPTKRRAKTDGIFYREARSYNISWMNSDGSSGATNFYMPNASPVDSLDVKRAAFVSQTYVLLIRDGIPYEVYLNKPSQIAAVGTFPLTVANALVSIPLAVTNLLQLKFDIATGQNKLLGAEAAGISNQIVLHQIQQQLDKLMAGNTNAASTNGTTTQPGVGGKP